MAKQNCHRNRGGEDSSHVVDSYKDIFLMGI